MATPQPSSSASPPRRAPEPPDVPLFLQKAYHMIDTCNAEIGGWSSDGLAFVIKDPRRFETQVIPQFFKHNKFSSFVRQLNFYGFRKVKIHDSLRINRSKEATKTAKFQKFRHDKFRRGRKDLLIHIKRTPSTPAAPRPAGAGVLGRPAPTPATPSPPARPPASRPGEVAHLRTEVRELKQKIASMSVNMDELTDMVKKVSVDERKGGGVSPVVSSGNIAVMAESKAPAPGNKRKKMDGQAPIKQEGADALPLVANWHPSSSAGANALPDWQPSSAHLAEVPLLLGIDNPLPEAAASAQLPDVASSPPPSDDEFVDDLFKAFAEDETFPGLEADNGVQANDAMEPDNNRPCPRLMRRIEDSLATLPRDMHEMVAKRLIDAIAETRPLAASADVLFPVAPTSSSPAVPGEEGPVAVPAAGADVRATATPSLPLPVAVAALKTLLAECGVAVECKSKALARERKGFTEPLPVPVVPMHA